MTRRRSLIRAAIALLLALFGGCAAHVRYTDAGRKLVLELTTPARPVDDPK
jgi:hypothetical protein